MAHLNERDETFVDKDGVRKVPADSDTGTTHDPNSITTETGIEPEKRHPPKSRDS